MDDMWIEELNLENIKPEDLQPLENIDKTELVGTKTKIKNIEIKKGKYGPVLILISEPLRGNYAASKLFSIDYDPDTKRIGWRTTGKLAEFLNRTGVTHPKDLIGKEAIITINEKGYLTLAPINSQNK